MAQLPSPPGTRRRRNRDAPAWLSLPGENGTQAPFSQMPSSSPRRRWSAAAIEAWREWHASPMAGAWIASDRVALTRALRLVDAIATGRSSDHGALTALEDRLGLTPKARRALTWEIERAPSEPGKVVPIDRPRDPRTG